MFKPENQIDIENIDPKHTRLIKEAEDGSLHLDSETLAQIEATEELRLNAETIAEIDAFLDNPKTPDVLRKVFERIKEARAKKVGGIEQINYSTLH